MLTPHGKLKREITLTATEPTNLAFGGADGKTVFVTQRKGGFVESFRTDRPGREFCLRACAGTSQIPDLGSNVRRRTPASGGSTCESSQKFRFPGPSAPARSIQIV